jgi:hypothetical protein
VATAGQLVECASAYFLTAARVRRFSSSKLRVMRERTRQERHCGVEDHPTTDVCAAASSSKK